MLTKIFGKNTDKEETTESGVKPRVTARAATPSIISRDMNILGNIVSDGTVDIDGRVDGNVRAATITLRKDGRVNGDLVADQIHIYGQVRGLVRAKDVHLFSTAKVEGSVMHEVLSMEEGAYVDGKFKRTDRMSSELHQPLLLEAPEDEFETPEQEIRLLENIRLISNKG